MEITVARILPTDSGKPFPKILVDVNIYEDEEDVEHHRSATVRVYVDKREDISYAQLKAEAIRSAIEFLRLALSDRS